MNENKKHYGEISTWKGGQFYGLQQAYDLGLLGTEDVESIAYYFNNGYIKNRELELFKNFGPSNTDLLTFEPLSEETKRQIAGNTPIKYYGTYNGAVVFMFNRPSWSISDAEIAAGIVFVYEVSNPIRVWKDG